MSEKLSHLEQLIQRYLAGKASRDEQQVLHRWMESLDISSEDPTEEDIQQLKTRIDAVVKPAAPDERRFTWRRIVAAAAILICIGTVSFYFIAHSDKTSSTVVNETANIDEQTDQLKVIHNDSDQNKKLLLRDGTQVTLTPKSSIRFIDGFEVGRRNICLFGKAKFEVAKDIDRPFSVVTGDVFTTALGTVFWVTHLNEHDVPTVSLLSGKVEITKRSKDGNKQVLASLKPGDVWEKGKVLVYKPKVKTQLKEPTDLPTRSMDVKPLVFRDASLKEVFKLLSARYHTKITYSDADISGMFFYGTYDKRTALYDIIQHIALTNELLIKYDEATESYVVSRQIQSN